MKGKKYLPRRVRQMERSNAGAIAGIQFRIIILCIVLGLGWFSCDQGTKFLQAHPSYYGQ